MRSPKGVVRNSSSSPTKTAMANTMIHMRPEVMAMAPKSKEPDMKVGAPTSRLLAPKMERTACCSMRERPKVASSVSSGRP